MVPSWLINNLSLNKKCQITQENEKTWIYFYRKMRRHVYIFTRKWEDMNIFLQENEKTCIYFYRKMRRHEYIFTGKWEDMNIFLQEKIYQEFQEVRVSVILTRKILKHVPGIFSSFILRNVPCLQEDIKNRALSSGKK